MPRNYHNDDISFFPFRKELQGYSWDTLRKDAFAAVNVALINVPQAIAYTLLAGLPLFCGLFAVIYSSFIAACFGSSRHLVVGPSNAMAILIQGGTSAILFTYFRDVNGAEKQLLAVQILTMLCLMVGLFQILAAWGKLGRLTQFISYSVIVGYITGTAGAVMINQLFVFLGIDPLPGVHPLYEQAVHLVTHIQEFHLFTLLIGLGSLILLMVLKKVSKKIPAGVVTLAGSALAVHLVYYYFADSDFQFLKEQILEISLVQDNGVLTEIFPHFAFPFFDGRVMSALLPVAFAVALLSIMETTSVAKSVASNSGQRLSTNQEMFGVGLGNLFSAFISAMPISGSMIRTTVNYTNGAQTRFSAMLNACFVALILYIFSFFVNHIPLAALSAFLLVTAISIVNLKQVLLCLKATQGDSFVLVATFLSCFLFSLDIAFYIGIVLSIILYLRKAAVPHLVEYEVDENGEYTNVDLTHSFEPRKIRIIKVEGELFFGAADLFQTTLKAFAKDDKNTKVIILQLKNARDIDATVCLALQQLNDYLRNSGRFLILCGITQQVWDVLSDSGLVELIRKENLFIFDERNPYQYILKAIQRAKELINGQDQTSSVSHSDQELSDRPILQDSPASIDHIPS
jgi:sulfate permease, SulP family